MQADERLAVITARARRLLAELPDGVLLVAAAKSRTPEEVAAAVAGGVTCVGHNYVREAEAMRAVPGMPVTWHMIGHLQRNKAKAAVELFDMVETVDSLPLARALDKRAAASGMVVAVLLEVNSGHEAAKAGVMPEDVLGLAERLTGLPNLRLEGLMTMGPAFATAEASRPYFRETRDLYLRLADAAEVGAHARHLSMGMSDSYRVAIEEGATIVRIGTQLFGGRSA